MDRVPGTKLDRYEDRQSRMRFGKMKIFCGSSHPTLGEQVCQQVGLRPGYEDISLGRYERTVFSNENIFIKLDESVRGKDVYLIQTMSSPIHENIMEALIMIDALKRDSAWRINLVVPYLAYSRSDKKDQPRVPITARLIANMIETAGVDRYMTIDLHSGQIQGFFNIPGDSLTAFHLLSEYVKNQNLENLVVVATDLGFVKDARNWAEALGVPIAIVEKRRSGNDENAIAMSLIGDVRDKNVLLVDDEVNTAGSIVNAYNVVKQHGALDVSFAFSHAFFSEKSKERLASIDLKEIIFTNTLPVKPQYMLPNMTVLSVAPLLAEVMIRAHEGRSVGELFDE